MSTVKERIMGAVTVMSDADAEEFWKIILRKYTPITWDDIEEVEPDEIDLQMLEDIENDPECHEFIDERDIDWNN